MVSILVVFKEIFIHKDFSLSLGDSLHLQALGLEAKDNGKQFKLSRMLTSTKSYITKVEKNDATCLAERASAAFYDFDFNL